MNRFYNLLLFGCLLGFTVSLFGQKDTTAYQKRQIPPSEVDFLYSFYEQNGSHSPVTGGEGNEYLSTHATSINLNLPLTTRHSILLELGTDLITSASTDRIDFQMSSASKHDIRTHTQVGYAYSPHSRIRFGGRLSGSIESDYVSSGIGAFFEKTNTSGDQRISLNLQTYFDNLQWGWLDSDMFFTPQHLIYPAELQDTSWFTTVHRNSYNLSGSFEQIINPRMQMSISADIIYQSGLLSTPFHRVYFNRMKEPLVERLPQERWKYALGFRFNYFVNDVLIIRSFNRLYSDNFGIRAWTTSMELPIKLSPFVSIYPLCRFHTQDASSYFAPYRSHELGDTYYTSDFDLSTFQSWQLGAGIRIGIFRPSFLPRLVLDALALRYAHYRRSDGLKANIGSISLEFRLNRKNAEKPLN